MLSSVLTLRTPEAIIFPWITFITKRTSLLRFSLQNNNLKSNYETNFKGIKLGGGSLLSHMKNHLWYFKNPSYINIKPLVVLRTFCYVWCYITDSLRDEFPHTTRVLPLSTPYHGQFSELLGYSQIISIPRGRLKWDKHKQSLLWVEFLSWFVVNSRVVLGRKRLLAVVYHTCTFIWHAFVCHRLWYID